MTIYTQQYRYYPGCFSAAGAVWPARLRELLGGSRQVFNCPAQDERFYWTSAGTGGLSPMASGPALELGYAPGEPVVTPWSYFTYGYNMWGAGDRVGMTHLGLGWSADLAPGKESSGLVHASRVLAPADMIAIADSTPDGIWDIAIDAPVSPEDGIGLPRGFPGSIHRGGANVLFCDGHVQWFLQRELVNYSGPDGAMRRRRWHNDHQP